MSGWTVDMMELHSADPSDRIVFLSWVTLDSWVCLPACLPVFLLDCMSACSSDISPSALSLLLSSCSGFFLVRNLSIFCMLESVLTMSLAAMAFSLSSNISRVTPAPGSSFWV